MINQGLTENQASLLMANRKRVDRLVRLQSTLSQTGASQQDAETALSSPSV
jgi:hypothetical protein